MNHATNERKRACRLCIASYVRTIGYDHQFEEKKTPVIYSNIESRCRFVMERGTDAFVKLILANI